MTGAFIVLGKLIASSGLLFAFYWFVLRNRATYTASRMYLLFIPFVSVLMSTVTFQVYQPEPVVMTAGAFTPAVAAVEEATETLGDIEEGEVLAGGITQGVAETFATVTDYTHLALIIWGVVAGALVVIGVYRMVCLATMSRRMSHELTPDGFTLIRSTNVEAPCSFGRTIFMPETFGGEKEDYIMRHEKAHISHRHYVDVWVMELLTRIMWFNPFLWASRNELRNVHEFEADSDVLQSGVDRSVYQTILLEQVMDNGSIYANNFNHSFIRRRFMEMRHSTAGTLRAAGKIGTGVWLVVLFCVCTFTTGDAEVIYESSRTPDMSSLDQPGVFTIEGVVAPEITDSCYNIYLADEYLHINGETPVVTIPVVNKRFSYSIPLDRMSAGRVRCIFPGGELCPAWIDLFFVPGETVTLHVMKGTYRLGHSMSYTQKVARGVNALRRVTNWNDPHLPEIKGTSWEDPKSIALSYAMRLYVKEVIFNEDATVLRVASNSCLADMMIYEQSYLQDEKGNKYMLHDALYGDVNDNNSPECKTFGGYFAFDKVRNDVKRLDYYNGLSATPTVRDIMPASRKNEKPNFYLDIDVSTGINDSGYIVDVMGEEQPGWWSPIKSTEVDVKDKHADYATYLDKPEMIQLTATFPDGSICTHSMIFYAVPGEKATLKVMNGSFYLTGSKFYREWGDADDLVENAGKYHTPAEREKMIMDYLKEHNDEEGCVMYYVSENLLPLQEIRKIAAKRVTEGRFKEYIIR